MKFEGFFGGSYQSQAVTADQERCINFYPEVLQSPGATAKVVLYPTPGVELIDSGTIAGNGRGHFAWDNIELAAIGHHVYAIGSAGITSEVLGWALNDGKPVTISGSRQTPTPQYLVTSGGEASLIYQLGPSSWLGGMPGTMSSMVGKATMGDFLDGRFLILDANTSTLYISAVFNGASWSPGTDFAQRTLAPDPWKAMKVVGRYIWLFGEQTTEIWQDTGANFPFAPFPSSLLPYGIAAPYSAVLMGNGVVWLATNKSGKRCVVYASGQTPEVISTYPIEAALSRHDSVESAVGDSYSENGHTFYLLSLDEEPETTYVWDLETKLWHERGTWRSEQNRYESWRPRFYAFAHGEHRMLDKGGAGIYRMSSDLLTDVDGLAIRRMRRAPAIQAENKRVFYSSFELDIEPGLATVFPTEPAELIPNFTWVELAESAEVTFNASTSVGAVVYDWDFGDGNTDTGVSVLHTYAGVPPDAAFTVTLTVTSLDSNTASLSATVTTVFATGTSGSAAGPTTAPDKLGRGPHVMLRLSNDGGKTWTTEQMRSAGKLGEYGHRIRWDRMGSARRRVFEMSMTDPGPWRVTGCYLKSFVAGEEG